MPEEHKIFMEEYEKYGNNCTLIAKVLSTWTPAQIKKHAEYFFRQNLKTNSAAVKQYQESLSLNRKAQVLVTHAAEQQNYQQSLSPEKKLKFYAILLMHTGHNASPFLLRKKSKVYKLMLMHIRRNKNLFHLKTKTVSKRIILLHNTNIVSLLLLIRKLIISLPPLQCQQQRLASSPPRWQWERE